VENPPPENARNHLENFKETKTDHNAARLCHQFLFHQRQRKIIY